MRTVVITGAVSHRSQRLLIGGLWQPAFLFTPVGWQWAARSSGSRVHHCIYYIVSCAFPSSLSVGQMCIDRGFLGWWSSCFCFQLMCCLAPPLSMPIPLSYYAHVPSSPHISRFKTCLLLIMLWLMFPFRWLSSDIPHPMKINVTQMGFFFYLFLFYFLWTNVSFAIILKMLAPFLRSSIDFHLDLCAARCLWRQS